LVAPQKPKRSPPNADLAKDRLTFSAWPPKVDGTGAGVARAYIIALAVIGLLALNVLVGLFRPQPPRNLFADAVAYLAPAQR